MVSIYWYYLFPYLYLFINSFIFMKVISQKVWKHCKTPNLPNIQSCNFKLNIYGWGFVINKIRNFSILGKSLWMRSFTFTCFKDVYKKVECSFKFHTAATDWQVSLLGWSLFIVCKKSTTCLVSSFHSRCWQEIYRADDLLNFHHSQGSTCPILIYFKL